MKVFAQEINDGLLDLLSAKSSVAYTNKVSKSEADDNLNLSDLIQKDNLALANSNPGQVDLYYLESVLVSTGWNKNDDIFLPDEVWAARKTPEDKQFNYMHNEKDIIGHITSNRASDFDNNYLPDEPTIIPKDFNIITKAVIYKSWSDPELQERIDNLITEIEAGEWYVSMECVFPKFDYALKSESGEIAIVDRSEATAYLTKHLRAYGGDGTYEKYQVGRVLRNLVFSGKGLVNRPANPRSVIINKEKEALANIQENDMSKDENQDFTVALQSELVDLKADYKNALAKIDELTAVAEKVESLESQIATLTSEKEAVETKLEEVQATNTEAVAGLAKAAEENTKLSESVASLEKDVRDQNRKSELTKAGVEDAKLDEMVAQFDSIDNDAFAAIVEMLSAAAKSEDKEDKKDKKEDKEGDEESYSNDLDSAEETEETSASVTETDADEEVSLRSVASEWFGKNLNLSKKTNTNK